jgi:hypothetical protein
MKAKTKLVEALPGRLGNVTQRALPGQHGQPVHRRPDRVLNAVAPPPVEHSGVNQLVECGAELPQRRAVRPGSAVRDAVRVLLRQRERGGYTFTEPGYPGWRFGNQSWTTPIRGMVRPGRACGSLRGDGKAIATICEALS